MSMVSKISVLPVLLTAMMIGQQIARDAVQPSRAYT
jgi:hypothetical protein